MRYYYTDAIKAAWMGREFKFILLDNKGRSIYPNIEALLEYQRRAENPNLYIAYDCHEMLKPQEADVVTWTLNHGNNDKELVIKQALHDGHPDLKWITHFFEEAKFSNYNRKIIQRNGVAFFMPEEEKAKEGK